MMRDKLVELLEKFKYKCLISCKDGFIDSAKDCDECVEKQLADYLIASGVVVLPCKVGDVVYVNPKTWSGLSIINCDNCFIHSKYFLVADVVSIIKTRKQNLIKLKVYNRTTYTPEYKRYPISSIGKTVFLTKEEAEAKLKGGADNA